MNKFEKLLQEAEDKNVKVHTFDLGGDGLDGLYMDGNIALSSKLETTRKKTCVLAEELGHYYTTAGDILDQSDVRNQKQERIARGWAYAKYVPFEDIERAHHAGYAEIYDMAEYLNVDEGFLREALGYYKQKYGYELSREQEKKTLDSIFDKILNERT